MAGRKARLFTLTAPVADEDSIQAGVVRMLEVALPEEVEWVHFPAGFLKTKDSLSAVLNWQKLMRLGFKKGRPDLQFVWTQRIYYIEMKNDDGSLSKEQKVFRDWCMKYEVPWALCRSAPQVHAQLVKWGFPIRHMVF